MRNPLIALLLPAILAACLCGCQDPKRPQASEYKTLAVDPSRNTDLARMHNDKAFDLINDNNLTAAEKELKVALAADGYYGPAHNNLGSVYLQQKNLYLAAWEFQLAAKLMPTKAQPLNNLGMVHEASGKLDEAAGSYEEALKLEPENIEVIANLARIRVRTNRKDARTRQLLTEVVQNDQRPEWVAWAKERLALMGLPPATQSTQPEDEP